MAHLGGGAEAHARFKQYEYRANSSLVLTTDSRPRDTHEPTGEPESLYGKIDPRTFGDRAFRGRPTELDEKLKKSKKKKEREPLDSEPLPSRQSKRRRLQEESVLTSTDEGVYQPKTKETRAAYEAMLSVIQQQLGGQPLNIVSGAADEILVVLKNDTFKNPEKKKEIEKLLNQIPNHMFDQLVAIGRLITDYQDGGDAGGSGAATNGDDALDDDVGVAVEFEENEEEEEESDLDMVQEDEEDDDDVIDGHGSGAMQMGGIDDDEAQEANEGMILNVQDIDAYWLQRKISQAYDQQIDPQQSQKLAEEVLKILAEGDDREVETKLLVHLQFDKFNLIKYLLRNRLKIVWCTRLARAEDQEKRKNIEEEMTGQGPELAAILEQLHATRATAKERQKNLEKSIRACSQLTYEGLLDELLRVNNGAVELDASIMGGQQDGKKMKVPLNSSDKLFKEIRDLNFEVVVQVLRQKATSMKQDYTDMTTTSQTVSELKDFVRKLNSLPEITRHINLAQHLSTFTSKPSFLGRLDMEHTIVEAESFDICFEYIEEMIHKQEPLVNVLRLIILFSVTNSGLPKKNFDYLRRELLHSYGFEHMATLSNLETAGLLRKQESKSNWLTIKRALQLVVEDTDTANPSDISYVFSGYAPLSIRLIQHAIRSGWRPIEEILKLLPGPHSETKRSGFASSTSFDSLPGAAHSTNKVGEGRRSLVLVVFIGGVTFAEISALRFLSAQEGMAYDLVVATTNIVNGHTLTETFMEKLG